MGRFTVLGSIATVVYIILAGLAGYQVVLDFLNPADSKRSKKSVGLVMHRGSLLVSILFAVSSLLVAIKPYGTMNYISDVLFHIGSHVLFDVAFVYIYKFMVTAYRAENLHFTGQDSIRTRFYVWAVFLWTIEIVCDATQLLDTRIRAINSFVCGCAAFFMIYLLYSFHKKIEKELLKLNQSGKNLERSQRHSKALKNNVYRLMSAGLVAAVLMMFFVLVEGVSAETKPFAKEYFNPITTFVKYVGGFFVIGVMLYIFFYPITSKVEPLAKEMNSPKGSKAPSTGSGVGATNITSDVTSGTVVSNFTATPANIEVATDLPV